MYPQTLAHKSWQLHFKSKTGYILTNWKSCLTIKAIIYNCMNAVMTLLTTLLWESSIIYVSIGMTLTSRPGSVLLYKYQPSSHSVGMHMYVHTHTVYKYFFVCTRVQCKTRAGSKLRCLDLYTYMLGVCYVQSLDSDHPRILLRKAWISAMHWRFRYESSD